MTKHSKQEGDAFILKGSLLPLTIFMVKSIKIEYWVKQLEQLSQQAPNLFRQMPVVLDFSQWERPTVAVDFPTLKQCLADFDCVLVGARALPPTLQPALAAANIALMTGAKPTSIETELLPAASQNDAHIPVTPATPPVCAAKFINKPVRSGQQIYAKNTDLIVMAPVSNGAELLADGFIHIYGPLRGRALAGISGNTEARIFCQSMEAELIAIAGCYLTNEEGDRLVSSDSICVHLQDDTLHMTKLLQKYDHLV